MFRGYFDRIAGSILTYPDLHRILKSLDANGDSHLWSVAFSLAFEMAKLNEWWLISTVNFEP